MQYVGETGNALRQRHNGHRQAINTSNADRDALAKHLILRHPNENHSENNFVLTPIEQVEDLGQKRLNLVRRRLREQEWIKVLHTFEPIGMNQRVYNYKTHSTNDQDILPFIIPYSSISSKVAKIIKKHIQILQDKETIPNCNFRTITAYSRHTNLTDFLVSSKMRMSDPNQTQQ